MLGTLYALTRASTWVATQEHAGPREAVGELNRAGRFDTSDARKAAQETTAEGARSRQVVMGTLRQFQSTEQIAAGEMLDEGAINSLMSGISVTSAKAPIGADRCHLSGRQRAAQPRSRQAKSAGGQTTDAASQQLAKQSHAQRD